MRIRLRSLGLIGLLGGLGGAINAWMCYANLPPWGAGLRFEWHVIPAGWAHGALLAVLSIGPATLLRARHLPIRLLWIPIGGWLSGWISWIPLSFSTGYLSFDMLNPSWETWWWPYYAFGLVGVLYYFFLTICRQLDSKKLLRHVLMGTISGAMGTLWWWISAQPWYFSLIHGTIWGTLVGFGVWKAQRFQQHAQ